MSQIRVHVSAATTTPEPLFITIYSLTAHSGWSSSVVVTQMIRPDSGYRPASSMELESVENVVVDILSRHECCCLPVSDLFVLCTRVFAEHLIPRLALRSHSMPRELHALEPFIEYLKAWDSSKLILIGEGTDCVAQLCVPLQQNPATGPHIAACAGQTAVRQGGFGAYETPDQSETSGASSTLPFYDVGGEHWGAGRPRSVQKRDLCATYEIPEEQVSFIRQLLCRCLFDFVLKEANAHSFTAALPLEDARQTCVQYLVRDVSSDPALAFAGFYCIPCLLIGRIAHILQSRNLCGPDSRRLVGLSVSSDSVSVIIVPTCCSRAFVSPDAMSTTSTTSPQPVSAVAGWTVRVLVAFTAL